MKIGTSITPAVEPAAGPASGAALRPSAQAGHAAGVAPAARARAADQVDVSAAGAQMGALDGTSDFDSAKVDAIRQAIRDGKFTVNAGAIADRLIADATSLLGPRPPAA